MMTVRTTTDTAEILGRLEPVLITDPVRNTIFASVRDQLRAVGTGGWCAHNRVALAARSGVALPIALTEGWADVPELIAAIATLPSLSGIGGPVTAVEAVVAGLDRTPRRRIAERLFRLDKLVELPRVPGSARPAGESDLDLVTRWATPYTVETFGALPDEFDPRALATSAVTFSRSWLWCDGAGEPVSMATRRRPAAGVSRIGPVYTPPEHRGHGYGSAVTARAAFDILDLAGVPVLYTDVANPTSNKIYRAIGFRPVTDRLSVSFR
jgi:GNAT superfamily N-acetyltransferase